MDFMQKEIKKFIPYIEPELLKELEASHSMKFSDGQVLLHEGVSVPLIPIVVSGRLKVFRRKEDKELLLYYIRAGESCAMSFHACMTQSESKVIAISEGDTEAIIIPNEKLLSWLRKYPSLNAYMFKIYAKRYTDLLDTVDQLIFGNMEDRVLKYLAESLKDTDEKKLQLSHQEIAYDLGSAREVVSRVLKKL
ncbi:MAG: Crp/Fnr family transcriptional regulator, partial [Bacteroidota bacterium]